MATGNIQVGDPLILNLELWDAAEDKHIKAILLKVDDGIPLAGSPYTVPHVGGGEYRLDTGIVFPEDTFEVKARFTVYNDAGFTEPSGEHNRAVDIYRLGSGIDTVIEKIEEIEGVIENISSQIITDDELEGTVANDENIVGEVIPDGEELLP